MRALKRVEPEDDDSGSSDGNAEDNDSDSDEERPILPDCFEKRWEKLTDLPMHNDEKWPQENTHYFRRKKKPAHYVRTDKYKLGNLYQLCKMLPEEATLPSILSVYRSKK